eukprot:Awhi_evm1s13915
MKSNNSSCSVLSLIKVLFGLASAQPIDVASPVECHIKIVNQLGTRLGFTVVDDPNSPYFLDALSTATEVANAYCPGSVGCMVTPFLPAVPEDPYPYPTNLDNYTAHVVCGDT